MDQVDTQSVAATTEAGDEVPNWWGKLGRHIARPSVVYSACFAFGTILIAASKLCFPTPEEHDIYSELIKEIGVAFIIASILGFSIEQFNKFRHEREIKKHSQYLVGLMHRRQTEATTDFNRKVARSVIEAVYGASIPEEIISAVTRFVLQARRIRLTFEATVELHRLDKYRIDHGHKYTDQAEKFRDSQKVALVYFSKWIDQNVGPDTQNMQVPVEVLKDGPEYAELDKFIFFRVFDPEREDGTNAIDCFESEMSLKNANLIVSEGPQSLIFEYTAKSVPPRSKIGFMLKILMIQEIKDEHIVMCKAPCQSTSLRVHSNNIVRVDVSSIHSESPVEIPSQPDWRPGERRFRLSTAALPCQGFVLNWIQTP